MELPPFNQEDFDKWKDKNIVVKECDMEKEMRKETIEHIQTGMEKSISHGVIDSANAAKYIKEQMDRQFGPSWHCIIGEGYSFEVTRQSNATMLMYYAGKNSVLLFKC